MNTFLRGIFSLGLTLLASTPGWAHEDERVAIELESPQRLQAGENTISFQLVDTEQRRVLAPSDLKISHEKLLHVFIFDAALGEYFHLHPEFVGGTWKTTLNLKRQGSYMLWAQGELTVGAAEFKADTDLTVLSGFPASPAPPALLENRNATEGPSRVTLSNDTLRAGRMVMPTLSFTRTDGSLPDLTRYLGELAHVVVVSQDGKEFLHVHPMDQGVPNRLMLHMTFEKAGAYRAWVQFVDAGELKAVALALKVL